jgi:hypothetical protein
MNGRVALVREHEVDFAVVCVRPSVMSGPKRERDELATAFSAELGVPAVLMIQNSRGTPTYHGRPDLVACLSTVCVERLRWREFRTQAA